MKDIFILPQFEYGRTVTLTVPGKVVAKQSTKFARRGKFVTTYTDTDVAMYGNLVRLQAMEAMHGQPLLEGAIECVIRVYVQVQSSISKKERALRLSGINMPIVKPDNDNMEKQIFDACQGVVFDKDQAICLNHTLKVYSEIPRVEIGFREIIGIDILGDN